jgi:hypothetical protein
VLKNTQSCIFEDEGRGCAPSGVALEPLLYFRLLAISTPLTSRGKTHGLTSESMLELHKTF